MEWNIIVGLVCTALGAVISYATFSHNKGKDDRSNGQQLGTLYYMAETGGSMPTMI